MSKNVVVVGAQWGDEGKGKVVDWLTERVDGVVRFNGGHNAGHTLVINGAKTILRLIPSGIMHPTSRCYLGNGVVFSPEAFFSEIEELKSHGVDAEPRIHVSGNAPLIMPYHVALDHAREAALGANKIGTTGRGIGPAYADKMHRCGIRAIDLTAPERLEPQFRAEAAKYNKLFSEHGIAQIDIDAEWERVREAAAYLAPRVCDTVYSINAALKAGKNILCEGAQGALLDIDHGTYPFVTSSNTISGGACTGAGIAPQHIRDSWGVIKAYTTRVGEGPFPTELFDEAGEQLRQVGREFGATTGRPRRCGWFDAVAAHYACMVDGINKLAVTKLDVLDQFEKVAVCVAYEIDGRITKEFPASIAELQAVKPVLEWLPGWQCDTTGATSWNDLPENARNYLKRMAELVDSSIAVVSVGPRRDQTFMV